MNPGATKRRKKSAAQRVRPFWFLVIVLMVLAVAAGAFLVQWPALRPHPIVVRGNVLVSKAEIVARAHIDTNANVWLQSTRAMRRGIASIPDVLDVRVTRVPPAALHIDIVERAPFARVQSAGGVVVVDRNLRVMGPVPTGVGDLPLLVSHATDVAPGASIASLAALRDDDDALLAAHLQPVMLEYDRYEDLIVELQSGITVLFGDETNLAKTIPMVAPIVSQVSAKGLAIRQIDLRAPGTPVVTYKEASRPATARPLQKR